MKAIRKIILLVSNFGLLYSLGIFLGRITGYFREIVIANKFNVSTSSDNLILILSFPDLINNFLSVSVISVVVLPLFARHPNDGLNLILFLFKKIFIAALFFFIILFAFIFFYYDLELLLAITISLFSVFPNFLSSVLISFLNYKNSFFVPSLGTFIFNSVLIFFILLFDNIYFISFGVVVSSIVRFWPLINESSLFKNFSLKNNIINQFNFSYKALFLAMFSNGVLFLIPLTDKIFASKFPAGSISILSYAEKIYLFPVSVFLTSLSVVALPGFVKLVENNNFIVFFKVVYTKAKFGLFSGLFVFLVSFLFSDLIVDLFYGFTGLSELNISLINTVFVLYTPILIVAGVNSVLLNSLFALKLHSKILIITLFIFILKFIFNCLILYFNFSFSYLALVTSSINIFSFFLFSFILYRLKIQYV
jgi:putative peptidoglycan lipid II flippase